MIWYCTGWTTSPSFYWLELRFAQRQNAFSLSLFTVKWSDRPRSVGRCGVRRLRLLRLRARLWLRQGTHFMQMNSRPINILFQLCLPLSLSLSLSLCSVFSLRVFHSLYFEGGRRRKWSSLHLRDLQLSRFLFSLLTKWHSPCTTG